MKFFNYTPVLLALTCSVTSATAVAEHENALHVLLGRAPEAETVSSFLKRTADEYASTEISKRDDNYGLRSLLIRASPEESVGLFVKRTCPGGNGNTCCPQGKFRCSRNAAPGVIINQCVACGKKCPAGYYAGCA
ncbi:Hypothetical protein D9617_3g018700 [Elsinoe fawcettii]|nr:Hypothetical protein D9617_3g018700 [Elsinoe fawcettii]